MLDLYVFISINSHGHKKKKSKQIFVLRPSWKKVGVVMKMGNVEKFIVLDGNYFVVVRFIIETLVLIVCLFSKSEHEFSFR